MGIKISNLPEATEANDADLLVIVQSGTTKKIAASLIGTGGGGGISGPYPAKIVATPTYTFLQEDHGKVIEFTNAVGCEVTVPYGLTSGTTGILYGISGTISFAPAGPGIAEANLPISLSSSTQEAFSVAVFSIETNTGSFILGGDLLPANADPLTDDDFTSNGRMVRNGLGNYNTILDQLSGTNIPFSGSDFNAGYRIGSMYVDQTSRSAFICVDDTPGSASWRNVQLVNPLEYDMYVGSAITGTLLFQDDFLSDLDLWGSTLNGAGSSVASSANTPSYGYVFVSPGTTFTGSAAIRTNINTLYASLAAGGFRMMSLESIAYLPDAPPDPVNNYYVRTCGFLDSSFNTSGVAFMASSGSYGVDSFWKMTRWNAGVTSSMDTTFLALTGIAGSRRFRIDWDIANATASFYMNGLFQGVFTGSQLSAPAAGYITPGMANKLTGTAARRIALDYTKCYGYFSGTRAY
jgi:hypothetical protein